LPSLKEIDIDAKESVSKKITLEMVDSADKIIVIGVDKNTWPDFLIKSKKVEFWDIDDPAHKGMQEHRDTREQVKKHIERLVDTLNN
jgi:protein-tyrosine-phosphatase